MRTHAPASAACAKKTARPSNKNRPSSNAHTFASKSRERAKKNCPSVKQKSHIRQCAHMRQQEPRACAKKIARPSNKNRTSANAHTCVSKSRERALRKNRQSVKQKSPVRQCAHMRQQELRARSAKTASLSNKNRPSANAHTCVSKCCARALR
ncbi:hypothetical protein TRSA_25220 (plasmid) [Treponema saccharophilum]|nr:hypothetical protein TRSA_25220 [Treponema saccharophilum]